MNFEALTLARLADLVAEAGDERRDLLVAEFMEGYSNSVDERADKAALLQDPPPLTGDGHWDALLAGLAEHLAVVDGLDVPDWVGEPSRDGSGVWYYLDLPSARVVADRETPEPFRRRGVMIRPVELSRA